MCQDRFKVIEIVESIGGQLTVKMDQETFTVPTLNWAAALQFVLDQFGHNTEVVTRFDESRPLDREAPLVQHSEVVALQTAYNTFLTAEPHGQVIARAEKIDQWEEWYLLRCYNGSLYLKSHHYRYLRRTAYDKVDAKARFMESATPVTLMDLEGGVFLVGLEGKWLRVDDFARVSLVDRDPSEFRLREANKITGWA